MKPVKRSPGPGRPAGGRPSEEVRETARSYLWGEVKDAAGHAVTSTIETPEGYRLTAVSAVTIVERVLAGKVPPGAWTPSKAFGADFVAELPGVFVGEIRPAGVIA